MFANTCKVCLRFSLLLRCCVVSVSIVNAIRARNSQVAFGFKLLPFCNQSTYSTIDTAEPGVGSKQLKAAKPTGKLINGR